MKTLLRTFAQFLAIVSLLATFRVVPVAATSVAITGGTNGALCTSGGYFTPSSVTLTSGSTVTISVPADDPYAGGIEVHGFPQGSFVVARGASVTTDAVTANVSYYGTWPSTGCMKGSGTITVSAPAPTPAPTPTPTTGGSTTTPSTSKTSTSTTPTTTSTPSTTRSTPTPTPTSTSTTTPTTSTKTNPKPASPTDTAAAASNTQSPAFKTVASIGGGSVLLLLLLGFIVWRSMLRRRDNSLKQPVAVQPSQPPDKTQNDSKR